MPPRAVRRVLQDEVRMTVRGNPCLGDDPDEAGPRADLFRLDGAANHSVIKQWSAHAATSPEVWRLLRESLEKLWTTSALNKSGRRSTPVTTPRVSVMIFRTRSRDGL